jgi:hypothetical protein
MRRGTVSVSRATGEADGAPRKSSAASLTSERTGEAEGALGSRIGAGGCADAASEVAGFTSGSANRALSASRRRRDRTLVGVGTVRSSGTASLKVNGSAEGCSSSDASEGTGSDNSGAVLGSSIGVSAGVAEKSSGWRFLGFIHSQGPKTGVKRGVGEGAHSHGRAPDPSFACRMNLTVKSLGEKRLWLRFQGLRRIGATSGAPGDPRWRSLANRNGSKDRLARPIDRAGLRRLGMGARAMFDRDAELTQRKRGQPHDRHSQHFRQEAHSSPHDPVATLCEKRST